MANPFLERGGEPGGTELVFVILPGSIDPEERERRFGDALDTEMRMAGIGYVSGGGTQLSQDGRRIVFAGVDVDTVDVEAARAILRDHLPELGCPRGTRLQYGDHQDRFDGTGWHTAEPRDGDI